MRRCPDCGKEVFYGREYCHHCSAALFNNANLRHEIDFKLTAGTLLKSFWER